MNINPRPYQADDLARVFAFVGELNALPCAVMHAGDVGHIMANMLRGRDLDKHIFVVEDSGRLLALITIYKASECIYNLLIHPDVRAELQDSLIAWSERTTWELVQAAGVDKTAIGSDVTDCDTDYRDALIRTGYAPAGAPYLFHTTRSLSEPIPDSKLPDGFTIRSANLEEADAVGALHSAAFGSKWGEGEYIHAMTTPGFDPARELLVVAPDGRLAAFCVIWLDPVSKSGLFEPVGCHPDFQRRGLTSALMYEGLRRMKAGGMETAVVLHEAPEENPASPVLYARVGFRAKHAITEYRKSMQPDGND